MKEHHRKESPILNLLGLGGGIGGGLGAGGSSVVQATGGTVKESNGYFYHHFDGVGDIYASSTVNDTNFSNYSLETRSVSDRGADGAAPTSNSFCIVLKSAQQTVDVRTQNTGGSTSGTYSFWYSTDNGSTFSPHPATHTGAMNGGTAVTIGPHSSPFGGVTHVVYSRGASTNRYYWAPTPVATFIPEGDKTVDIVMTGGGGAGGTSGGGAGGLVHYTNVSTSNTITLSIGKGGTGGAPGTAPGAPQIGSNSTITGPDFPATITAAGGGGGGAFNVSPFPFAGGSGGGGYSTAGGNNQGPGGPGTQPGLNTPYSPLPTFNQYGSTGGKGSTKIGYIYAGGGGGAGETGGDLPSPTAPTPDYQSANQALGGNGQPISGFEYPYWYAGDLTPYSPSNNHFGGGGGAGNSPGNTGGHGGGGDGGNASPTTAFGIPTLGGGAGGSGSGRASGGSGGIIIRYLAS
tara:strand:- start:21 stop:1400 length:1380 start_codon:yes stop_codon:yes gene_type:complete